MKTADPKLDEFLEKRGLKELFQQRVKEFCIENLFDVKSYYEKIESILEGFNIHNTEEGFDYWMVVEESFDKYKKEIV